MVALLGPELTVSLPRHVTAIIGMDAFAGAMLVGLLIQKKIYSMTWEYPIVSAVSTYLLKLLPIWPEGSYASSSLNQQQPKDCFRRGCNQSSKSQS